MFSLADALVLRPLPVSRPGEIVTVAALPPAEGFRNPSMSYPDYLDIRERARSFNGLTAYQLIAVGVSSAPGQLAQRQVGVAVTETLFETAGLKPTLGRWFRADENQVGAPRPVVVLDYDTWTEQFESDPRVIDRHMRLSGIDFTVIGVAPDGFTGLDPFLHPAFYVPLAMVPAVSVGAPADVLVRRDNRWLRVKGRLNGGVTLSQARQDVAAIAATLGRQFPATNRRVDMTVRTELEARTTQSSDALLVTVLMTLSIAVLLVACANVAGLLASRAPVRARELALRLAMGAGRTRVVRQLLTESLLLALGGGLVGLAVAYAGIALFRQIDPVTDLPGVLTFELDRRVLAIGMVVAIASALVSSLLPAWRATSTDLARTLKDTSGSMPRRSPLWGRHGLVCVQVAMALVLVTVSVWLYRGVRLMETTGPGYRTDHLLMLNLDPGLARYNASQSREFYRALKQSVLATPGVEAAALTSDIPLHNDARDTIALAPDGHQFPAGTDSVTVQASRVDEGYFSTMNIPIVEGRGLTATDIDDKPAVGVVNTALARRYWPGRSAIGKRIRVTDGRGDTWVEVVGVAATVHYNWVAEAPTDFIYLQRLQVPTPTQRATLLVQTAGDAAAMAPAIREAIRDIDSNMPVFGVRTMSDFYRARALTISNVIVGTVAGMGSMGLLLALVGLYALVAASVNQRTREIGIRMAVGAPPGAVLTMVLRHGLVLSIGGVALGLVAAYGLNGLLRAAFPASGGLNTAVVVIVVPAVLVVALVASLIPARRAARVDPLMALRQE